MNHVIKLTPDVLEALEFVGVKTLADLVRAREHTMSEHFILSYNRRAQKLKGRFRKTPKTSKPKA
jgi:hypothetical protein